MASVKGHFLKNMRYDYSIERRIEEYIERENWNKNNWKVWIENRLQRILYDSKKYVPFYKEFWKNSEKSYELLENWPLIDKKIIIDNPNAFIDMRFNKSKLYIDHTSGTTGTPINIFLDHETIKNQYALFEARVKRKYDIRINDKWAIFGSQRVCLFENKKPPFWVYNYAANQLYFSSLHIADWSVLDYFKAFQKYQPCYIVGYTNSIYELAFRMLNIGLTFPLKAVVTNAEPLYSFQKNIIQKVFKCSVVETYGQAELVTYANRFPDGKMYQSPEMGMYEIINKSEHNGLEYGELIGTSLISRAMPFIRYNTNDLITCDEIQNQYALPEFGKILGRNDDVIILKDGRRVVQIDGIFSSNINIIQGQIIQQDFNKFHIKIVPSKKWNKLDAYLLKKNLAERIGEVDLDIELCSSIEKTWAGKFRAIKSNMHN